MKYTFTFQSFLKIQLQPDSLFYRAVLQVILKAKLSSFGDRDYRVGRLRKPLPNFVQYARWALRKLKLDLEVSTILVRLVKIFLYLNFLLPLIIDRGWWIELLLRRLPSGCDKTTSIFSATIIASPSDRIGDSPWSNGFPTGTGEFWTDI